MNKSNGKSKVLNRVVLGATGSLLFLMPVYAAEPHPSPPCNRTLTLALTPDVDTPVQQGLLSSLLGNHPAYRLSFLADRDGWSIDVVLSGPGPDYLCDDVIEFMRKDARVDSIEVR